MARPVKFTAEMIAAALHQTGGDTAAAATLLGCNPSLVRRRRAELRAEAARVAREQHEQERAKRAAADDRRQRLLDDGGPRDFRDSGACLDEDPELFFPIGNTGPALLQIEEAKAVCRTCDVIEECLRWALDRGEDAGVWGGLSEDERRTLKRRNTRARRAA